MRRIDSLPQYGPHVDATERMHAVVVTRYGGPDVLEYSDVPRPAVRSGQVLVKSAYIGVNPKDVIVRKGKFARMTGKKFPLIVGHDIAGQVIASGPKTDLQVGDKVYGMINDFAGRAYAQYAAVDIDQLARIPDGLSMQEAAAIPLAAQTALQALRDDGKLKSGQRVLINGASGGVGTFAVQIAKIMGAHVTAVCSEKNRALVEELGADVHVDYKTTDILAGPGRYDIVFDVFGNYIFEAFKHKLTAAGRYVNTVPSGRIVRSIVDLGFEPKEGPACHRALEARAARLAERAIRSWRLQGCDRSRVCSE